MTDAIVTLDVLHQGPLWGWYVTMNFWAKSIATGVILLLPYLLTRKDDAELRLRAPIIGFIFLNVTLLFTLLDLHQPMRFWYMFVHPHFTSSVNIGSWILTAFNGLLVLQIFFAWKKKEALYDKLLPVTWVVAGMATVYTAALMGQANAREIWHAATEVPQMILTALMAGTATLLLIRGGGEQARKPLSTILALSATVSFLIFLAEIVLAPQKSEEAEYLIHLLLKGEMSGFFLGGLAIGFVLPVVAVLLGRRKNVALLTLASVLLLIGLWLVKHSWLIAPQLIPLS